VTGVIGRKPAHLLSEEDRSKASKIKDLWIDIGATSAAQARERVSVGDAGVIEQPIIDLGNNRIAGRGVDNRMGAWVALETLRLLSQDRPAADVYALAAVQEEITFLGARTAAFSLEPDVAIVLDVTHATDHPDADKRGGGDIRVGGGPVLARGSAVNPRVQARMADIARNNDIPFAVDATPRGTGTDADAIAPSRGGVPTAVVSVPNRYMHSPNEVISLDDLDAAARLISLFIRDLGTSADFIRR
jgi:endoglucanase